MRKSALLAAIRPGFVLRGIATTLMAAWVIQVAIVAVFQRQFIFRPDTQHVTPGAAGLTGISEQIIPTPDGEKLVAWWCAAKPGKPTALYFHGNGGNLSYRSGRARLLQEAGYGVLMLSARGYGGSTGSPSEAALVADAGLAYDWLRAKGVEDWRIVVFGESLGTGIAVQLAAARPVGGVILDSPYSALVDVAAVRLPYMPVRSLMWDTFRSMDYIGRVHAPLLIVHGDHDDVVPYEQSQRLFAAANEPKRFLTLPGAGHVVPLANGAWSVIEPFLAGLPARP